MDKYYNWNKISRKVPLDNLLTTENLLKLKTIFLEAKEKETTSEEIIETLSSTIPIFKTYDWEKILRTIEVAWLNNERLESFRESAGFIKAVQFNTALCQAHDKSCQKRDSLVFALEDPHLETDIPPFHWNCQAVITSVSYYRMQEIEEVAKHRSLKLKYGQYYSYNIRTKKLRVIDYARLPAAKWELYS